MPEPAVCKRFYRSHKHLFSLKAMLSTCHVTKKKKNCSLVPEADVQRTVKPKKGRERFLLCLFNFCFLWCQLSLHWYCSKLRSGFSFLPFHSIASSYLDDFQLLNILFSHRARCLSQQREKKHLSPYLSRKTIRSSAPKALTWLCIIILSPQRDN